MGCQHDVIKIHWAGDVPDDWRYGKIIAVECQRCPCRWELTEDDRAFVIQEARRLMRTGPNIAAREARERWASTGEANQ